MTYHTAIAARHPTPAEIRSAITHALWLDLRNPETPYVPVHVERLIDDAITAACDQKGNCHD